MAAEGPPAWLLGVAQGGVAGGVMSILEKPVLGTRFRTCH